MSDQPKTSDILNRGADLIEKHGHHKGGYGSADVGFCLMGACNYATGHMNLDASTALCVYLGGGSITAFNDADDRTATEVIEVLRAAALIEAAREDQAAAWETYAGLVTA